MAKYKLNDTATLIWLPSNRIHHAQVINYRGKLIWFDVERKLPLCDVDNEERLDFRFVDIEDRDVKNIEDVSVYEEPVDASLMPELS